MSLQEVNDGPRLTPEGEQLLRSALERRAGQTRWDNDILDTDEAPLDRPPLSTGRKSSGTLVALSIGAAIVLIGLVVAIGALAGSAREGAVASEPTTGGTGLDPIDPEVMGRSETAAPETEPAGPVAATSDDGAADSVPPAPRASAPELLGTMELQSYATGQSSITSFVVRARQVGGETIETAHFSIAVIGVDGPVSATLQFEQVDLPAESSAVAVVRLADPLTTPATLQLRYDGTTVAEAELTPTSS